MKHNFQESNNGIISSDDPNALSKLREKLADLEAWQQEMKSANKAARGTHPSYKLTNNNGNMARIRERIKGLEKMEGLVTSEETLGDVRIVTNAEANRLQFIFPGKPSEAVRSELKSHGFHWSPMEGAWQRMLPVHKYTIQRIKDLIAPPRAEAHEDTPSLEPHPMDGRSYPEGY